MNLVFFDLVKPRIFLVTQAFPKMLRLNHRFGGGVYPGNVDKTGQSLQLTGGFFRIPGFFSEVRADLS